METQHLKVGELARRTGLSVRALHHYDAIGLLSPSRRTAAGHRLYTGADVARLLRIRAMQQLGFALDEIRAGLDDPRFSPVRLLDLHVARLGEQLEQTGRLRARLTALRERLRGEVDVSVGEFLETIEEMTMFEKYYTPEQLEYLKQRRAEVGEDRIREVESEWPQLIAAVRAEMDKGTDPSDPKVQALAARWQALVEEFTGGDAGIRESLRRLYAGEPQVGTRHGIDPGLSNYVGRALRG